MARSLFIAVCLAVAASCAPATASPMVMRLSPGAPERFSGALGIRSGPRLSAPLSRQYRLAGSSYTFHGDRASFSFPQWGVAYDFAFTRPVSERTSLHVGPFPLGTFALAPALCIRGATDLGLLAPGGPGSIAGVETSLTLSYSPDSFVSVGLVPFCGMHHVWSDPGDSRATYLGAVVAAVITLAIVKVELSSGFGRVFMPRLASWNVPIIGARAER